MRTKVVGDGVPLPIVGQMPAADDFDAAMLGAAGVQAMQDPRGVNRREVIRARQKVVDAFAAGAVGAERLPPAIEVMPPSVDESANEDLQLTRLGAKVPDAAAIEPADAVRCFDVAVDVDRLIEIQQSFRTPAERVQNVVRVFGAKAREQRLPAIGASITVGVAEMDELGAVGDIRAAVTRLDAGGNQQAIGEDAGLVRLTIAVAIFQDDDPIVGHLAGENLRIDLGAGHPQSAGRVEVHLDRLGDQRIRGVERDFKTVGNLKRLPLELRIGGRNVLELTLSECGTRRDCDRDHEYDGA